MFTSSTQLKVKQYKASISTDEFNLSTHVYHMPTCILVLSAIFSMSPLSPVTHSPPETRGDPPLLPTDVWRLPPLPGGGACEEVTSDGESSMASLMRSPISSVDEGGWEEEGRGGVAERLATAPAE